MQLPVSCEHLKFRVEEDKTNSSGGKIREDWKVTGNGPPWGNRSWSRSPQALVVSPVVRWVANRFKKLRYSPPASGLE